MKPLLVYSPGYDFSMLGLERLHPFDARKYSRAFGLLRKRFGRDLDAFWREPKGPISETDLLRIHSKAYLASLESPAVVAKAVEVWPVKLMPRSVVERGLLAPMRLATAGTSLALTAALDGSARIAMNLGGGFHHAFSDRGEGFCIYADVAVAIATARARGALGRDEHIIVIDLDAHRGNGFWEIFKHDAAVHILDLYNFQAYPGLGDVEEEPFIVPLKANMADSKYFEILRRELSKFLDSVSSARVAVYNAGTDIVIGDPVGRLAVTPDGVRERDRFIVNTLAKLEIPTVIVTSGGYTNRSHELVADLAGLVLSLEDDRAASSAAL